MANVKTIEKGLCSLCGRALLTNEGYCDLKDGSHICININQVAVAEEVAA